MTAIVCAAALALAAPNLLSKTDASAWPDWLPRKQLKLDIEFTGGTSLLLEPDLKFAERDIAKAIRDRVRQTLRDHRIRHEDLRYTAGTEVKFRAPEPDGANWAKELLTHETSSWYAASSGTRSGVTVNATENGELTIGLNELGARSLRQRLVESGILRLHRQMRCLGIDDYRIVPERDGIRLTTRQPSGKATFDGCRHL